MHGDSLLLHAPGYGCCPGDCTDFNDKTSVTLSLSGVIICTNCIPPGIMAVGSIDGVYVLPWPYQLQTFTGITYTVYATSDCSGESFSYEGGVIITVTCVDGVMLINFDIDSGPAFNAQGPPFTTPLNNTLISCDEVLPAGFYPAGYGGSVTVAVI